MADPKKFKCINCNNSTYRRAEDCNVDDEDVCLYCKKNKWVTKPMNVCGNWTPIKDDGEY